MDKPTIEDLLARDDVMDLDEANVIASAIRDGDTRDILAWLTDVIECDGTNNESKLAAILRGILLKDSLA